MTQIDLETLQTWVGRTETRDDVIAPFPANALAATLDRDDPPYEPGTALPPLWHWLYFLDLYKLEDAGYDGHAALGGFLPPVPLPRRMWAGSRLIFNAPLEIGTSAQKTSRILKVTHKSGASGDLVFVTVGHTLTQDGQTAIDEEHDIVYRAPADPTAPSRQPPAAKRIPAAKRQVTPTEVLLFRYSALTFNGHRIHYDHPFCIGTEGYDGLVVHGPLLATLMLDLIRRTYPGQTVTSFEFRAQAPVTGTTPFHVETAPSATGGHDIWIKREDGVEAMRGLAKLTGLSQSA